MSCEDFPCCGHESGCCPDFDAAGRQLNMVCVCGKNLPVDNRSSCCDACLRSGDEFDDECDEFEDDDEFDEDEEFDDEPNDSMDGDFDSCMSSAGYGMDEDYNHYDYGGDEY